MALCRGDDFRRALVSLHPVLSSVDIGELQAVEIGHDKDTFGSGWYLENITVHQTSPYVKRRYGHGCTGFCQ